MLDKERDGKQLDVYIFSTFILYGKEENWKISFTYYYISKLLLLLKKEEADPPSLSIVEDDYNGSLLLTAINTILQLEKNLLKPMVVELDFQIENWPLNTLFCRREATEKIIISANNLAEIQQILSEKLALTRIRNRVLGNSQKIFDGAEKTLLGQMIGLPDVTKIILTELDQEITNIINPSMRQILYHQEPRLKENPITNRKLRRE